MPLTKVALLVVALLISGCWEKKVVCTVTPPASVDTKDGGAIAVGADLTALAKIPIDANLKLSLEQAIKATFQKVPEKSMACQMLFQTIACATENKNTDVATQLAASVRPICSGENDPNTISIGHKDELNQEFRRNALELENISTDINSINIMIQAAKDGIEIGNKALGDPSIPEHKREEIALWNVHFQHKISESESELEIHERNREKLNERQSEIRLKLDSIPLDSN